MTRTTVTLPDDLAILLVREARRRETSVSDVVRRAVESFLGGSGEGQALPFVALGLLVALALVVMLPRPAATQTPAQSEEAAILAVIDNFMHAVTKGDEALMASTRRAGTTTTVERPAEAGGTMIVRRDFKPAEAGSAGAGTGPVRERYWDPVVHVRGGIAVVWTPYEFWRDGRTSHCGVDVFELVREQGTWRIGHVMYTVEPDACPALRPADPSRVRPAP